MAQKGQGPQGKQLLPSKEASLFKSIVKFYESKQYKKGIKSADAILKKFPNHGETLAMKGLILNCLEKKEEAYDHVRRGLKQDLASHVSWHVYGLLYRSDRNYSEAIKCYKNALRNDKDNQQILRDLSWLQVHLRDVEGFMETRRQLLTLKPAQKTNWTAFSMSHHLAKDYQRAIQILDEYEKTMDIPENPDFETSEFVLYKTMVIEESGDIKAALEYLNKIEKLVVDKLYVKEKRGEFLLKLDRHSESEKYYRELLSINPDNHHYHTGLQEALHLVTKDGKYTPEQVSALEKVYDELLTQYPKSDSVQRLPLNFLNGETFKAKVSKYIQFRIRKGVPSLFIDLKSLYSDQEKVTIIADLILSFVKSLESQGKFPDGNAKESPDAILWTKFFLAQHYDTIGETKLALETIDQAIAHTPTVIELYSIKGRIYKHAGDVLLASNHFEKAREMDLADRYLNAKSAKYLLRSDQIDRAISTLSLFTKEGDDVERYLFDMQAMWFEQECGDSHYRLGSYGKALKKFTSTDKHFADIVEDQFDFHTYSLRKMTLRSYIKMLRLEDNLFSIKFYVSAAKSIARCYLDLHDKPKVDENAKEIDQIASMSEDEKKIYLKKKKKEQIKKEDEEKKKASQIQKPEKVKKYVDPDPEGNTLVDIPDKLGEAAKFLQILLKYVSNDMDALLLSIEVYLKKKKYLLVLRSIKKALSVEPENPHLHVQVIKFVQAVEQNEASLNGNVKDIILSEQKEILGGKSLVDFNAAYISRNKHSMIHQVGGAQGLFILSPAKKQESIQLATQVDPNLKGYQSLKVCIESEKIISSTFGDVEASKQFKEKCKKIFPHASHFMNETELQARLPTTTPKVEETH